MNDTDGEMREMTQWISSLPGGKEIPLHVTRFFPRYRVRDKKPTDRETLFRLVEVAGECLRYVWPGNI